MTYKTPCPKCSGRVGFSIYLDYSTCEIHDKCKFVCTRCGKFFTPEEWAEIEKKAKKKKPSMKPKKKERRPRKKYRVIKLKGGRKFLIFSTYRKPYPSLADVLLAAAEEFGSIPIRDLWFSTDNEKLYLGNDDLSKEG